MAECMVMRNNMREILKRKKRRKNEGKNVNKFNETSTVMRRTEKTEACLQQLLVGLKVSL